MNAQALPLEPAQSPTRRTALRLATTAHHAALDELSSAFDLANPEDYRCFLETSAAALLPLEALLTVSGVSHWFGDWPERMRGRALCNDLSMMRGEARPMALQRALLAPAEVFGVLYVLEGSRLGARVLVRRVRSDVRARTYLSAADPRHWQQFLQVLEAASISDERAMLDAACYAFDVFTRAFRSTARR